MNTFNRQLIRKFKALADPVRLRLVALCASGECAVAELTAVTGLSQPRVSQHLKTLCDAGLLTRFRDGHFVFYRTPSRGADASAERKLMALVAADEQFDRDLDALRTLRSAGDPSSRDAAPGLDRDLYRQLVELTVTRPLGDLLDIGSGRGDVLKLLASRAKRAVGVDIDRDARQSARAQLLEAGIPNCSFRQGDMYRLPQSDATFDTVILDDVLFDAERPLAALAEASRVLKPDGRLIVLSALARAEAAAERERLVAWCHEAGLRLAPPKLIPATASRWLLAVASRAQRANAAA